MTQTRRRRTNRVRQNSHEDRFKFSVHVDFDIILRTVFDWFRANATDEKRVRHITLRLEFSRRIVAPKCGAGRFTLNDLCFVTV